MMKNKGILCFLLIVMVFLAGCSTEEPEQRAPTKLNGEKLSWDSKYVGTLSYKRGVAGPSHPAAMEGPYHWTAFEVNIWPDKDCVTLSASVEEAWFGYADGYKWIEGPLNTFCLEKVD